MRKSFLLPVLSLFLFMHGIGQVKSDTSVAIGQRDMLDIISNLVKKERKVPDEEAEKRKKHFSVVPAIGYTLQTGFAAILSGNMAFYTDTLPQSRLSVVSSSITYSQYNQIIVPVVANIWLKGDTWNLVTDFRYIKYPSDIYGLGGPADPSVGYTVDFNGFKFHQTVLRKLRKHVYGGLGYYFDRFYNISPSSKLAADIAEQVNTVMGTEETSSGYVLRFLFDNRINPINSTQGLFFNATYRGNLTGLGSDANWSSLQLDARTYFHFPASSKNVMALWTLQWLTTGGEPPFLMLPSIGWDDNYNSGRGYIQGRFRGRNMHYLESEYRYRITRNGLVGGVAFVNFQKFSDDLSPDYAKLHIGYGLGLRIKLNKYSGTNLCIDYGFGANGSRGFFVNLAEVF